VFIGARHAMCLALFWYFHIPPSIKKLLVKNVCYHWIPQKICYMSDMSYYRVSVETKNSQKIIHLKLCMIFYRKMQFLFCFLDNWYFPYSATYQTHRIFSKKCNGDIYFLLWAMSKRTKNLTIEQYLNKYKKAPLERFTF